MIDSCSCIDVFKNHWCCNHHSVEKSPITCTSSYHSQPLLTKSTHRASGPVQICYAPVPTTFAHAQTSDRHIHMTGLLQSIPYPKISKAITPLWLQLEISEAMTKIFSWKAILTQDEHKMPPTLPPCSCPCFNNNCLTKSHHFRSTGQNQGLRLTVFDALGRVCHTPQAHRQVGHPPQIIARGLHDIQNPFHPPSRRPEMKARCCTKSWQGASGLTRVKIWYWFTC